MTDINIAGTLSINPTEFTELASDILDELVQGDASPFKDALEVMKDYLEDAQDLDPTQKAGILSDFLKDSYQQINQQALGTALELLKVNEQLTLDSYNTEANYNMAVANQAKVTADTIAAQAIATKAQQEVVTSKEQTELVNTQKLEVIAKLKKQYGYNVESNLEDTYVIDSEGRSPGDIDYVPTTITSTNYTLGSSTGIGALDKQIVGYDKVNYKDMLKAINEMTALLVNANVIPGPWMVDVQKYMMELITDNKLSISKNGSLVNPFTEIPTTVSYTP